MRWSLIRLIWMRELKDQLRDRRTLFMMIFLPLVLYPAVGLGLLEFTLGLARQTSYVGVQGIENLPAHGALAAGPNPLPAAIMASLPPFGGLSGFTGPLAEFQLLDRGWAQADPPLVIEKDGRWRFAFSKSEGVGEEDDGLVLKEITPSPAHGADTDPESEVDPAARDDLNHKRIDALIVVPGNFREILGQGGQAEVRVLTRSGDDHSRRVGQKIEMHLGLWAAKLTQKRLLEAGLPAHYDSPVAIIKNDGVLSPARKGGEGLLEILVKVIPFMVVMWSLAGALYPAVDLCAGEKERGTLETLLISPAGREEIVIGKFLTIWVFSAVTALLNLFSLAATTWHFRELLPLQALRPAPLAWCLLLVLPLAAFFSAISLAIGAYARSSKEGQYYLLPLFLLTMPLIFLSLAPGVQLNAFYSMVPVTGMALLMQGLMTTPGDGTAMYFIPVLAPMALYGWFALRWAIDLFQREEVLFREAERLDLGLWFRNLFREKEGLPDLGLGLLAFGLVLLLRFIWLSIGERVPLWERTVVGYVGLLVPVPLFMGLILTARPGRGLGLTRPAGIWLLGSIPLAVVLLPPRIELKNQVLAWFPQLVEKRLHNHPVTEGLHAWIEDGRVTGPIAAVILAVVILPAFCEELAFRGFILTALRRRFGGLKAMAISSFLYAVYQMNAFKFGPAFCLGLVLAFVTIGSRSVLPAMAFQVIHNGLRVAWVLANGWLAHQALAREFADSIPLRLAGVGLSLLVALWIGLRLNLKGVLDTLPTEDEDLTASRFGQIPLGGKPLQLIGENK